VVEADERTVEMEEHLVGVCPPFVVYRQPAITFYVGSEPMEEFGDGLPEKRMKLYVNAWFPTWLDDEEHDSDHYAYVDWIEC
jgi:hypothetical protein